MNKEQKKEKNKNTINVDEEPTKNVNIKKLVKKKFEKKNENSQIIIIKDLDVKNLTA